MRKGEEGLGKIVGERETHENTMFVCIHIRMSEGVRVRSMNGERATRRPLGRRKMNKEGG